MNNFLDSPHLVVHAEYINAYDLGFGRDMNCLDNGRTSCCRRCQPSRAEGLKQTRRHSSHGADAVLIANDYGIFRLMTSLVDASNQIKLDGEGAKSVPESCYACHKGYTSAGGNPVGGEYLPFDIDAFEDWPGKLPRPSQRV